MDRHTFFKDKLSANEVNALALETASKWLYKSRQRRDPHAAQELAQEVLVRLLRARQNSADWICPHVESPGPFVSKVTRNTLWRRRRDHDNCVDLAGEAADQGVDVEVAAIDHATLEVDLPPMRRLLELALDPEAFDSALRFGPCPVCEANQRWHGTSECEYGPESRRAVFTALCVLSDLVQLDSTLTDQASDAFGWECAASGKVASPTNAAIEKCRSRHGCHVGWLLVELMDRHFTNATPAILEFAAHAYIRRATDARGCGGGAARHSPIAHACEREAAILCDRLLRLGREREAAILYDRLLRLGWRNDEEGPS